MELAVISGKGGTGKTTIATALSELENNVVRIDCDVDAPNFYLFYNGSDIYKEAFYGGKKAEINPTLCVQCGKCEPICKFEAIHEYVISPHSCEGCGACTMVCSKNAIALLDEKAADAYVTQSQKGIISRAQMSIGSDGSGKLITHLRKKGKEYSEDAMTIIDGSPGIGCPVISSITGADAVLVVTEPTQSGLKDLERVVKLCQHFGVLTMVCINKWDINEKMTKSIEAFIQKQEIHMMGRIPYDDTVMKSINELVPLTEYKESKANEAILHIWKEIKNLLGEN